MRCQPRGLSPRGWKWERSPHWRTGCIFPSPLSALGLPDRNSGSGLQEPPAWVIPANLTVWPWLAGAGHPGPVLRGAVLWVRAVLSGWWLASRRHKCSQATAAALQGQTLCLYDLRADSLSSEEDRKKAPSLRKLQPGEWGAADFAPLGQCAPLGHPVPGMGLLTTAGWDLCSPTVAPPSVPHEGWPPCPSSQGTGKTARHSDDLPGAAGQSGVLLWSQSSGIRFQFGSVLCSLKLYA